MANGWSLNSGLNGSFNLFPCFVIRRSQKKGRCWPRTDCLRWCWSATPAWARPPCCAPSARAASTLPQPLLWVRRKKPNKHCNHFACVFWSHSDGTCVSVRWQHKRSEGDLAVTWKGLRSHTGRLGAPAHIVQQIMSLLMNFPSLLSSFPKPLARTWC